MQTTSPILTLYDETVRRNAPAPPGYKREASATLVRHVGQEGPESFILYSDFTDDNADAEIAAQVAHFRTLGHAVEWKTYTHDTPSDLVSRLVKAGFVPDAEETLVVFDLENTPLPTIPDGIRIHRLTDPTEIDEVARIQTTVWGAEHFPWLVDWLRDKMRLFPDSIGIFAAVPEDQTTAQSVGWISYEDAPFAGLWGGSTMPEYRGRGLYRALVAARLAEVKIRNIPYATVDALPTSRPILERLGFARLTDTRPCLLAAPANAGDAV